MTKEAPSDIVRVHIWITGRVQGVGFRAFVLQTGGYFGLTGWVRNRGYDEVETVAEGRRDIIESFVEAVKTGPRASRIDTARVEWEIPIGESGFQVHY